MAADFDYGNARLHVMKSRLLSRRELEALLESGSLQAFITELAHTAYRQPVEAALGRASDMECISLALRDDLQAILNKIRHFYQGEAAQQTRIVLRHYDIKNLKALLRGLSQNVPASEILETILPVGELTGEIYEELAHCANPREAGDMLASMALPFARPLMELRMRHPGADSLEMEVSLEQWYFREAFRALSERQADGYLLASLCMDADVNNLLVLLRFVNEPEDRNVLRDWLGSENLEALFVGPGKLTFELLSKAGERGSVAEAIDLFLETSYQAPLTTALKDYQTTGRLSEFERWLSRFRLMWHAGLIGKDPLGIGVVLGYLALKVNEVSNLRWIAHSIYQNISASDLRSELVVVP